MVTPAVLAWAAAVVFLFGISHDDDPVRADAVVVLAGSPKRLPVGLALARRGLAPLLVVSRNDEPSPLEERACAGRLDVRVLCARADPYSTRGEARLIARLARERGWSAVDVVTSRFHVFRARFMVERCYDGRVRFVGAPNPGGLGLLRNAVLEPVKLVYHALLRGC